MTTTVHGEKGHQQQDTTVKAVGEQWILCFALERKKIETIGGVDNSKIKIQGKWRKRVNFIKRKTILNEE